MSDNPIFTYTRRDYEGSRKEGLARIPVLSGGRWTDLNATDPGVIILDYVHALVDMINYYQDHQALETFMSTAKERGNIFRIAKQLSYSIRSAKGAIVDVTFYTSTMYDHPIKIPKNTVVATYSDMQYLTIEDAYLPAGAMSVSVTCSQGSIYSKTYTGTGISRYSVVDGAADQTVYLDASNIDIDSISVTDNIGRVWTRVDYVVFSGANDRVYQLDLNADDTVTVKFGDGRRGVVPQESDIMTIEYVVTAAENGRVKAKEIMKVVTPVYENGKYVEFSVSNAQASSGGSSIQSSSEIKELAPGAIKAQGRAVTLSDFENLAKLVSGVSAARAYDINTKPDLCLYHEVKVLVVPDDPYGDVEILASRVYNYLYDRMIPPTNLQVLTPSRTPIDITITVKKADNVVDSRLEYSIYTVIEDYFAGKANAIGEDFYPSDLSAVVQGISEVKYVVSISPSSPVEIGDLSVVSLGKVEIIIQ